MNLCDSVVQKLSDVTGSTCRKACLDASPSSLRQAIGPSRLASFTGTSAKFFVANLFLTITYLVHTSASAPSVKMPPKFDPSEVKVITLRATGGEVGASSALAPKVS